MILVPPFWLCTFADGHTEVIQWDGMGDQPEPAGWVTFETNVPDPNALPEEQP